MIQIRSFWEVFKETLVITPIFNILWSPPLQPLIAGNEKYSNDSQPLSSYPVSSTIGNEHEARRGCFNFAQEGIGNGD